jgi:gliding motility-associated-like protein
MTRQINIKPRLRIYLTFFCLVIPIIVVSQKQSNIWCFGYQAEIDFNSGSPVPAGISNMYCGEACASISDTNGNLLFYTDGLSIWDANNQVMPNGNGLLGNLSSTQTFIIPIPESYSKYYVATVDNTAGNNGFRYTEVDMTLNGGLGDVTSYKNILLNPQVCEKIAVAKNSNGTDLWLIVHVWNSSDFYAYKVSNTGIDPNPIITSVGVQVTGDINSAVGYMKVSRMNNKIAIAHRMDIVEILDFDNTTGQLSNPIQLSNFSEDIIYGTGSPYGLEFSPNGRFLYVSEEIYNGTSHLYQYDLQTGLENDINSSRLIIGNSYGPHSYGALQIGPDKKIYIARNDVQYLGVINQPDNEGNSCQYDELGVYLDGKTSEMGLPVFISDDIDTNKYNITYNVFTPNGDGYNDYFYPVKIDDVKNYQLVVYNRWGNIIFITDVLTEGWDGKYDGSECSEGVYFWFLNFTDLYGKVHNQSGFLELLK